MSLVETFVNLPDRIRIGTRVPHHLGTLIIYMLADASVNVDYEDLPQRSSLRDRVRQFTSSSAPSTIGFLSGFTLDL